MKTTQRLFRPFLIGLLYVLAAGHPVLADDTEVLIGSGGQVWAKPNVLFIMDTSGSMGWDVDAVDDSSPKNGPSRLSIVQGVFSGLMNKYSGFNVALMRFNAGGNGGHFVTTMQELTSSSKDTFINAANAFEAKKDTPLAETLYEATRFWQGLSVDFGKNKNEGGVPDDGDYNSPITSQCQKNYTILLTDGVPNGDDAADKSPRIPDLPSYAGGACAYIKSNSPTKSDSCLDEVAGYLHTVDQHPGADIPKAQTVNTYTIGFTTDQVLLKDTATAGGGDYYTTKNADELSAAFNSILGAISGTNNTFSPPALGANAFSGVSHFNKLYLALFEPAGKTKWDGNVKPYTLNNASELIDAGSIPALDTNGAFKASSRSLWSGAADGGSIAAGGANGQLPAAADREIYTYTGGYDGTTGLVSGELDLTKSENALINDGSSSLTADMLGITATDFPDPLVREAKFNSVLDSTRGSILGSPLHSQPVLVTYGGTEASPTMTLFVATNDGFLHALDAATGEETFAFIPQELLPNLIDLADSTGTHPYGLDGAITTWVKDNNGDHTIDDTDGDHVYAYVGMRRGGNNYYALDVTTPTKPKLKWVIRGGASGTPGFEELGQSWSKPTLTTINYGGGTKKVLIFGGGYDTAQDANPVDTDDTIGRAIYIVNADTGARLWWAGPKDSGADLEIDELTNSIPSDVRLLDSDLDDSTDRLYVGDMRGQVFRIDLKPTLTDSTGILLAQLGNPRGTTVEADNRRFFYPPDVVVTKRRGTATYVSVNIGSGYRAHPLNPLKDDGTAAPRVNDRFYALHDPNVQGAAPSDFDPITDGATGNLFEVTAKPVLSSDDITDLAAATGWYITLGGAGKNGEKVLAPSVTINGEILFTTFTPPPPLSEADSNCTPEPGTGKLYRVSLFDGSPLHDFNHDGDIKDVEDRIDDKELRRGIPPGPTAVFREKDDENVEIVVCVGLDCEPLPDAIKIQKLYWQNGS